MLGSLFSACLSVTPLFQLYSDIILLSFRPPEAFSGSLKNIPASAPPTTTFLVSYPRLSALISFGTVLILKRHEMSI